MGKVTIDFVGMCLVLNEGSRVSIGFIDDPGHLHLITYYDFEGLPRVLPLTFAGSKKITLTGVDPGETEVRRNGRLPDLREVPDIGAVLSFDEIVQELRTVIVLTGGILHAEVPIDKRATGPWFFTGRTDPDQELTLTDRLRFSTFSQGDEVKLHGAGDAFVIGRSDVAP